MEITVVTPAIGGWNRQNRDSGDHQPFYPKRCNFCQFIKSNERCHACIVCRLGGRKYAAAAAAVVVSAPKATATASNVAAVRNFNFPLKFVNLCNKACNYETKPSVSIKEVLFLDQFVFL